MGLRNVHRRIWWRSSREMLGRVDVYFLWKRERERETDVPAFAQMHPHAFATRESGFEKKQNWPGFDELATLPTFLPA